MFLVLIAWLGGVLTIFSPCILPVLPFVFARSDQPFRKSGLPLLAGMAVTFAAVASIATVGGGWAVRANEFGRTAALVLFGIFGLTLIFSSFAERLMRPLVRLGGALSQGNGGSAGAGSSFLLGVATGLLWAPCAGPILGLILTGAALQGASASTAGLLLAYALGAATSLAVALLAGNRVFTAMKKTLGAEEWIRRILGVAILLAIVAVALGLDRGLLTRLSLASTAGLEQRLVNRAKPPVVKVSADAETLGSGSAMATLPDLSAAAPWMNSAPLTAEALHGHVVLIDFWTYSCINCLRTLPYVKAWAEKYRNNGLIVIGIHTPEFAFEKDESNVRRAVQDLGIRYPVAMDNEYTVWRAFHNQYWPAEYFVDATGRIRFHDSGEGNYDRSEQWLRALLTEAGPGTLPALTSGVAAAGSQAAPDAANIQSYETYIGYEKADDFVSPGGFAKDKPKAYRAPEDFDQNDWALTGNWLDEAHFATAQAAHARIVYRFHSRDLHLVLGPGKDGAPVRFRVTIDGQAPGADHGSDVDAEGYGVVNENRLYQLVRGQGAVKDRTFRIEFLSGGVVAYSFTFG